MASKQDNAGIKLTDFGLSTVLTTDLLKTSCGTLTYCAPEVLSEKSYGKEVDLWSIGVITFILLGGYPPFTEENEQILIKLILDGNYECNFGIES
jgi:calcium/calmodulin-dependent protein kinase I